MNSIYLPNSGDIIWVDFNPRVGHEQSGRRPCIVLSRKLFSEKTGLAIVCPITSKIKGMPYEIVLKNTKTTGTILPNHIKSIDLGARSPKFIEIAPENILTTTKNYVKVLIGIDI